MIRREASSPDGTASWILISQVEHARISGELASNWGANGFAAVEPRDELLPAIFGHDDGWAVWEQHPGIDLEQGRPLNFTEMPLDESLVIWQRSIDAMQPHGNLAGYVVSGHFSALLRHVNRWQKIGADHGGEAADFLVRQDNFRAQSLANWEVKHPDSDAQSVAHHGLKFLQFFDALSLWLCTAERSKPQTIDVPGGPALTLRPQSLSEIGMSPWPLVRPELTISVAGRRIPAIRYATREQLAYAESEDMTLTWRLTPDE